MSSKLLEKAASLVKAICLASSRLNNVITERDKSCYPKINNGEFRGQQMAINQLKGLPLGTSDFIALRMADEIYVDKTEMVFSLAVNRGKYFLARPRRFGKSLLISTFESLFKYGLRDFKGLAIENLWKEEATYNVVRLDFSEIKDFADAESFRNDAYEFFHVVCLDLDGSYLKFNSCRTEKLYFNHNTSSKPSLLISFLVGRPCSSQKRAL